MKLAYVQIENHPPETALWVEGEVLLLGRVWPAGAPVPPDPMAIIAGGAAALDVVRAAATVAAALPDLHRPVEAVTVLPPVPDPPRIFALARNYRAHAIERGGIAERDGTFPQVFMKPPRGTLNHHQGSIAIGPANVFMDYEAELAVVLGRGGRDIAEADALSHVFGYTVANDFTERKLHAESPERKGAERDAFFDWLNGKWMDGSYPIGPCLLTADAVPDPGALRITCRVNGEPRQDERAGSMIHPIPAIIAFLSRYLTLLPGDIISTGTPAGVGKARGLPLAPGDMVEAEIEGIGVLANAVTRAGQG